MSNPSDPTEPTATPAPPESALDGGDIVSLDEVRQQKAQAAEAQAAEAAQTTTVNAGDVLQPIMSAIARELSSLADPDGTVRIGSGDEAQRQKTAAVLRGIGSGLGAVLGDAFGKWAQKLVESGSVTVTTDAGGVAPSATPGTPPAPAPGDEPLKS